MVRRRRRCSSTSRRSRSRIDRNLEDAALPGAVGDPADVRRAPRLPRLRRHASRAASGGPATRSSCCPRACARASRPSRPPTGRSRRRCRRMSVTIRLADDVDVSRGNMLADPERPPVVAREVEARVCWMSERPLEPRAKLAVKHTTRSVRAIVDELVSRRRHPHARRRARARAARAERHRRRAAAPLRAARRRPVRARTARPARSSSSTRRRTTRSAPAWSSRQPQ